MWEKFNYLTKKMFRFTNGKKVVLWGYKTSGYFIEHLFRLYNKKIDYIIDDDPQICDKLPITRSFNIRWFDKNTHAILLTFNRDQKVDDYLNELGYKENENYIYLKELFYNGADRFLTYQNWMEYQYGMDIVRFRMYDELERKNNDSSYYSPGIDYALMDVISDFAFDKTDAIFDFGCGKGGALLLFSREIDKLGGVEFDTELYEVAKNNLKRAEIASNYLYHGDAALLKEELDEFNYFYMYNPFQGNTLKQVIKNLEESYRRNKRVITLIYSNPFCHSIVVENKVFKLSKQIYTDFSVRYVNIYMTV